MQRTCSLSLQVEAAHLTAYWSTAKPSPAHGQSMAEVYNYKRYGSFSSRNTAYKEIPTLDTPFVVAGHKGVNTTLYLIPLGAAIASPNTSNANMTSCSPRTVEKGCSCSLAGRASAFKGTHKQAALPSFLQCAKCGQWRERRGLNCKQQ